MPPSGSGAGAPEESSAGYSNRLTSGHYRGNVGLPNKPDAPLAVLRKTKLLAKKIRAAGGSVVLHTGAGLSTAAGISDFRGPDGIWTCEERDKRAVDRGGAPPRKRRFGEVEDEDEDTRGEANTPRRGTKRATGAPRYAEGSDSETDDEGRTDTPPAPPPFTNGSTPPVKKVSVEEAVPTLAHMVIAALVRSNLVSYVVSQNVDSLHLLSGVPATRLSELHGNLFQEHCAACRVNVQRDFELQSAGLRKTGNICGQCGGPLTDRTLDWDDPLPEPDFERARKAAREAALNVVVGSSLQMLPTMNLPFRSGERDAAVIVNLSETGRDDRAGMVIRAKADVVFACLVDELGIEVPRFVQRAQLTLDVRPGRTTRVAVASGNGTGAMQIPYVRQAVFRAGSLTIARDATKPYVGFEHELEGGVQSLSASVTLASGDVVEVVAGTLSEGLARCCNYRRDLRKTLDELQKNSVDEAANVADVNNYASWFVVSNKPRFKQCVLCGANLYSGVKLRSHIASCVPDTIAKLKAAC